jgi:ferritin-like metal-binding protein YciE
MARTHAKQSPDVNELLLLEARDVHSAESQLSRVLPRLAKAVESEKLRELIDRRLQEGERLLKALDRSFDELDASPGRKRNVAAEGLVNDAREHVQEIKRGPALDALLVGSLQKTEHYCIAAWGTVRTLAESVGQQSIVEAMESALDEGKAFDQELTDLSEKEIMPALAEEGEEAETEEDSTRDGEEEEEDERETTAPQRGSRSTRK